MKRIEHTGFNSYKGELKTLSSGNLNHTKREVSIPIKVS